MKHLILAILLLASTALGAKAIELPDEDLNYIVLYKWGLINKDAASAVLSLRSDGEHYYARMAAK